MTNPNKIHLCLAAASAVLAVCALATGFYQNHRRLSAFAVLEKAGSNYARWSRGTSESYPPDKDQQIARWFNKPEVIVTGLGREVTQTQLADAIATLEPLSLYLIFDVMVEQSFMEKIGTILPLEVLDFGTSHWVSDQNVSVLKNHPALKGLYLRNSEVTPASLETFLSLPRLEWLCLAGARISPAELAILKQKLPRVRFIP